MSGNPVVQSLARVLAVAHNTRREAYRNRAFLTLVILGVLLNAAGFLLSRLALPSQHARVIQDFGYFSTALVAVITAGLSGVLLLYKELDKKTIFTIIPKPAARHEIVLGKFVGLFVLVAVQVAGLGALWLLVLRWNGALTVNGTPIAWDCVKALALVILEASIVIAVALLFSSWTRPFLAGLFTFGYYVIAAEEYLIEQHLGARHSALAEPGPLRELAKAVTYAVPDLQVFNASQQLALGIHVPSDYVFAATGYASGFVAVFLVLAIWLFSRRDFV